MCIRDSTYPTVIKAEGLALGKGVIIAGNFQEAKAAIGEIMVDKIFGDSGNRVVIEEFLTGPEVSVLAFTDGKTIVPMVSAQDHKRAFDHDQGPNTGGMGTVSYTHLPKAAHGYSSGRVGVRRLCNERLGSRQHPHRCAQGRTGASDARPVSR